ncbi:MAG: FAD-binding oxidoreductase [Victivallales bacterium]|jgi:Na+-transporting NADH:ubiquinone oxidoreductase subunit F
MLFAFLTSVLIVSGIFAALAALLAVSEYYFSDYGECEIKINDKKNLKVRGGGKLLSALTSEKIFIPSACGGRGTCGLCKLKVLEGGGSLLPTEEPYLTKGEREGNVRLSCQIKVRNNLSIFIPEELFSIREYKSRCVKIVDLTHDMKLFTLELIEPPAVDYAPGQYMQLFVPIYKGSTEEVYRAYSVASDPGEKKMIDLIIRLVPGGICTTYCFNFLKAGQSVKMNGPYGQFRLRDTDAEIIFIAGGSGIAPIRCILIDMRNRSSTRKATFYFGANTVSELCLLDEMRNLESELPDFKFIPVVARPAEGEKWDGETGLVTDAVRKNLKNASHCEAYLCGSPGMIDASIKVLKNIGVTEDKIYYDKFA